MANSYVANDVALDRDHQQILMITGPNMSGKSALLRQTALIVLMAQMGCYVPARSVRMGVVDKVFTRVGASDNLSAGESTFMVEMNETASILHNLSDRSLVLLDEIGRGTSTYDGISIAWAIAEFLHEHPKSRAKTLFATHYHELNRMARAVSPHPQRQCECATTGRQGGVFAEAHSRWQRTQLWHSCGQACGHACSACSTRRGGTDRT